MRKIRPLDTQFEAETVSQIRTLQDRLDRLQITYHASRFFVVEAKFCLEAGLLLAAILVSTSMLELFVRETLVQARIDEAKLSSKEDETSLMYQILKKAEEDRNLSFSNMVKELVERSILSQTEEKLLTSTYKSTRIPINHAIIGRFVRDRSPGEIRDFIEETGLAYYSDAGDFERIIETQGVIEIGKVLEAIEAVIEKGAV